jgi:hypothetical protein
MVTLFTCGAPVAADEHGNTAPCGHQQFGLLRDSSGHTFLRCAQCGEDTALGAALHALNLQAQFTPHHPIA